MMFEETPSSQNFQGRYVMNHSCAGDEYRANLPQRFEKEAENLAELTGWDMAAIRSKMEAGGESFDPAKIAAPQKWYQRMWQ